MILLLVGGLALGAGLLVGAAVHHWPHHDPLAPRLAEETVDKEVELHHALERFLRSRLDARAETGLLLTVAVAVITIAMAAVGVLLYLVHRNPDFASIDFSAARFGAEHATSSSTWVLRQLTQLGGAVYLVPLALLVALLVRRRVRPVVSLSFLTLTVGGNFAVANGVKALIERTRPDVMQLTGFSGTSFPSGHATAAACSLAAFALLLGRGHSVAVRRALAAVAVALAVAVAASRVLLGVHWVTDVVAGLLLGWSWFTLCSIAFGGRVLRFAIPVRQAEAHLPQQRGSEAEGEKDERPGAEQSAERVHSPKELVDRPPGKGR